MSASQDLCVRSSLPPFVCAGELVMATTTRFGFRKLNNIGNPRGWHPEIVDRKEESKVDGKEIMTIYASQLLTSLVEILNKSISQNHEPL